MKIGKYQLVLDVKPDQELEFQCGIKKKAKHLTEADCQQIVASKCTDVVLLEETAPAKTSKAESK